MLTHTATIRGRAITWDHREVVQHGLNADRVELTTDREWQECDRIVAVLAKAGMQAVRVDAGSGFLIPSALMEDAGPLRMCLLGYTGESVRIVTAKEDAPLAVVESGDVAGMDPTPEQPDLWAQLMEEVRRATEGADAAAKSATKAESDLRAAAERGDFDGKDGAPGKTPVRGVDYWTPEDRKPIEDATLAATTAAGRADAAAKAATDATSAVTAGESSRIAAERGRVDAEKARVAADADRAERTDTAVASVNKAAQDAKTATDAAIAQTQEATNAAVARADKATASATTAANKAEAAVAQLPVPSGNVLKGEAESTFINLHDSWKAPIVKGKVLGQSNQVTTTGKNLIHLIEGTQSEKGLTLSIKAEGRITINGTCVNEGIWLKNGTVEVVEGKTYYLSLNQAFPSFGISAWSDTDNKHVIFAAAKQQVARGTAAKTETLSIYAVGGDSTTFNNEMVTVQIEEGQKTDWEPYTGGKPSPSPEYPQEITNLNKAEIVTTGRNLAKQSTTSVNAINRYSSCLFIEADLMPSTNYILSFNDVVGNRYYINEGLFENFHAFTTKSGRNVVKLSTKANISKTNIAQYVSQGWIILKNDKNQDKAPDFKDVQLEYGDTETAYEPYKSKSTVIDLKGNELCSLPNGTKDEVVIDAEGNVSLIKRVGSCVIDKSWDWNKGETQNGSSRFVAYVHNQGANHCTNTDVKCRSKIGICSPTDTWLEKDGCAVQGFDESTNCVFMYIKSLANETVDTFKQWITDNPFSVMYLLAEPQTIPLGKVELPALPEATSNIWNNGNIPVSVYINYLKDVNIAYADLESKLTQIASAIPALAAATL